MSKKIFIGALFCFAVLASAFAVRPQDANEKAKKEEELRLELSRKARVLVDEVATGALSLKLPENRSFILASAADLMWEHDEKRARNLFWDALNTLALVKPTAPESAKQPLPEQQRNMVAYFATYGMRRELLRKVARHDPGFAMDLLRSTQIVFPETGEGPGFQTHERELEHEIASAAAARDPKRALEIARESLSRGVSFQLLDLLMQLNARDAELGSRFAGEMIGKLQTKNLSTDFITSRILVELVLSSRPARDDTQSRQLKLDREQRRDLILLIANAASGLNPNPNLLWAIEEILPEFQEFAPERLPLLQKKLAAFNQTLNADQKGWTTHNSLVRSGSPEEMMRRSLELDEEPRRSLQDQAVLMAVFRGRADALRELIATEIDDKSRRDALIDSLDGELINQATDKGDADALRKLLPQVRLREERARAMTGIAVLLEKKGDHDEAVKLLDEARTLIKIDLDSQTQSNALMALMAAYALVDPPKAFAIIEKTVDRANNELTKLLLLDKIVNTGILKKGEIVLQQFGILPQDFLIFRFGKSLGALAKVDFDRTRAAADRLGRNELRLLARLMLARALVEETRKRA